MPNLLLPVVAAKSLLAGYLLPLRLQSLQMHGSAGTTVEMKDLTMYIQILRVNGFTYGFYILEVKREIRLPFICETGSGILHYPLKGGINILQFNKTIALHWNEEQYGLGYHPAGCKVYFNLKPGQYHFLQLAFSADLLQQVLATIPGTLLSRAKLVNEPLFSPALPFSKKVNSLIARLLAVTAEGLPDVLILNNCALLLIGRFVQDCKAEDRKRFWEQKKEILFAELDSYIQDHLDTDKRHFLSLSLLARKTGTSIYNFKKLFRRQYGRSPAFFIQEKRMEKAMHLLTNSSVPAGDIYQQVGYENFSSFSRAFRSYNGHPPSYYRNT